MIASGNVAVGSAAVDLLAAVGASVDQVKTVRLRAQGDVYIGDAGVVDDFKVNSQELFALELAPGDTLYGREITSGSGGSIQVLAYSST